MRLLKNTSINKGLVLHIVEYHAGDKKNDVGKSSRSIWPGFESWTFLSFVTVGELLSQPQFPYLKREESNNYCWYPLPFFLSPLMVPTLLGDGKGERALSPRLMWWLWALPVEWVAAIPWTWVLEFPSKQPWLIWRAREARRICNQWDLI